MFLLWLFKYHLVLVFRAVTKILWFKSFFKLRYNLHTVILPLFEYTSASFGNTWLPLWSRYRIVLSPQKISSWPFGVSPFSHPQCLTTTNLFCYYNFVFPRISYKWIHALCSLLSRTSFIYHNAPWDIHILCISNSFLLLSRMYHSLFIHSSSSFGLFPVFDNYK